MRHSFRGTTLVVVIVIGLLALALACGPKATPTPTAGPTATPTKPAATATPTTAAATPTSQAPTATPTSGATPTPTATLKPGQTPTPPTPTTAPATATPTPTLAPTPTPAEQPKRGGSLKMRTWRDPTTYDPGRTSSAGEVIVTAPVYNNLIWYNSAGYTIECELCTTWDITDNGNTHTFKLRQGVKFADGKELTSADIKWNLEKWAGRIDGVKSPRTGPIDNYIGTIDTPDPYTVVVKMKQPAPAFPVFLANDYAGIVQKDRTQAELKVAPYGTGPFRIKTIVPGADIVLERNPNYWKPGLPYLDEMHKVIIATTAEPAVRAAFVANQIDYSDVRVSPDLKPRYEELAAKGEIKIWEQPHHWMEGLLLNTAAKTKDGVKRDAPLDNVKVRQAINLAIDRDGYNQVVLFGTGIARFFGYSIGSPWNPYKTVDEMRAALPGWAKTGPAKDAEREQAKKLMAEAGYANGFTMEIIAEGDSTANIYFAGELAKIGITAKNVSKGNLFDQFFSKGDYDASGQGYLINTGDPDETLGAYFTTGGARNYPQYSNPVIDDLNKRQSMETDPKKRFDLVQQAFKILLDDVAIVQTFRGGDPIYTWKYVGGYDQPIPTRDMRYRQEWLWDKRVK